MEASKAGEAWDSALFQKLMVAYKCRFYFCLQAYNATSTSGNFQQTLISSWDQMVQEPKQDGRISTSISDTKWAFANIPAALNAPADSKHAISFGSQYALSIAFETSLNGTVEVDGRGASPSFTGFRIASQAIWFAANSTASMTARVEMIAKSVTSYIRMRTPAPVDELYKPTVFRAAIFVRVRWGWLAFPLVLLLAAYVFLAATVLQTRRRAVRPWKNQRLPLLLADVDDDVRELAGGGLQCSQYPNPEGTRGTKMGPRNGPITEPILCHPGWVMDPGLPRLKL